MSWESVNIHLNTAERFFNIRWALFQTAIFRHCRGCGRRRCSCFRLHGGIRSVLPRRAFHGARKNQWKGLGAVSRLQTPDTWHRVGFFLSIHYWMLSHVLRGASNGKLRSLRAFWCYEHLIRQKSTFNVLAIINNTSLYFWTMLERTARRHNCLGAKDKEHALSSKVGGKA